jgi:hypothetical protein
VVVRVFVQNEGYVMGRGSREVDWYSPCEQTGGRRGWCLPGHEADRDAARIKREQEAIQPNASVNVVPMRKAAEERRAELERRARAKLSGFSK